MKSALLLGLIALAGCQAGAASDPPVASRPANREATPPRSTGHLWLSVATSTHYPSIERFKLIDGVPQSSPDAVYGGYGGNIAVAGDGTLYTDSHEYAGGVFAFSPGSSQPNREITIPALHSCDRGSGGSAEISTIAADAAGYLFVGIYTTGTLSHPEGYKDRGAPKYPRLCEDVAVYSPTANGRAVPIQLIHFPQPHLMQSLAVDTADNLFVDDSGSEVDEFANATTNPQKTRVFSAYISNAHSIATDAKGNLYIASTDFGYKNGRVERYAPNADGSGPPTSTVALPTGVHLLEAIAERGRVLYVDDVNTGVDLYHPRRNGSQSPFYSLTASNVISVATGP
jgi:hypothetical protein